MNHSDEEIRDIDIFDIFKESMEKEKKDVTTIVDTTIIQEEVVAKDVITKTNKNTSSTVGSQSTHIDANSLFGSVASSAISANTGTGDVVVDLLNWLNNRDVMPSDPLSSYMNNSHVKAELSLYFLLLNNMSRVKVLDDFIKDAEAVLYNTKDIMHLDPDELKERYTGATKAMDNILSHSTRIVSNMKKNKNEEEMDKLKMLLGAIPSSKLKEVISNLK